MSEITLRTSERKTYQRCPQRWWWSYREGLVSNQLPANPLWFGTGVHIAFANYYIPGFKRGPHPAKTFLEWADGEVRKFRENYGTPDDRYIDMVAMGEAMLTGYVDLYKGDPDWEVLAPEYSGEVLVQRLYDGTTATYGLTLDGVYRDHGDQRKLKYMEHKTAATIQTGHLSMEPQAITYLALGTDALIAKGLLQAGDDITEITYNFLRKGMPDERPVDAQGYRCNNPTKADYLAAIRNPSARANMKREELEAMAAAEGLTVLGERSKNQPAALFHREPKQVVPAQLNRQVEQIEDELLNMDYHRNGDLPLYKVKMDMGPQACTGCPYFQMCEIDDMGGDVEEYKELAYHQEDPYAAHRSAKTTDG